MRRMIELPNQRKLALAMGSHRIEAGCSKTYFATVQKPFRLSRVVIPNDRGPMPWHWRALRWFVPGLISGWESHRVAGVMLEQITVGGKSQMPGSSGLPAFVFAPDNYNTAHLVTDVANVASTIAITLRNDYKRAVTVSMVAFGESVA